MQKNRVLLKMRKNNKVVGYQNLSPELLDALNKRYPDGYTNHVIKISLTPDNFFYAVTLDMPEASYLIKVPVKIDSNPEEFEEKDYEDDIVNEGNEENFTDSGDDYEEPAENED